MGLAGPEAIFRHCRLEGPVLTAIFVDLESNLNREFVSQGRELVLSVPFSSAGRLAMRTPNRARPPSPGAPVAELCREDFEYVFPQIDRAIWPQTARL